ncbi:MAG: hypothetical protein D6775_12390 [Caldilineae bacterium]|nr:MAG: hypothetical protein D6775_12390 [Caldilineae bacterium]
MWRCEGLHPRPRRRYHPARPGCAPVGHPAAWTTTFACGPINPDIMYMTDAWASVHISTDGGRTWTSVNQGIDLHSGPSGDAVPVFSVRIDPNDPNIVWIGLFRLGGIYRSADGGQTWERRTNGIVEGEGLTIRGFAIEPGNSDVVYAAGEIASWVWAGQEMPGREFDRVKGVVYKTTDAGLHWRADLAKICALPRLGSEPDLFAEQMPAFQHRLDHGNAFPV